MTYTMYRSNVELLERVVRLLRKADTTLGTVREGIRPWGDDNPERVELIDQLGGMAATLADMRVELVAIASLHTQRFERSVAENLRTTWAQHQAEERGEQRAEGTPE